MVAILQPIFHILPELGLVNNRHRAMRIVEVNVNKFVQEIFWWEIVRWYGLPLCTSLFILDRFIISVKARTIRKKESFSAQVPMAIPKAPFVYEFGPRRRTQGAQP